jgi:carbon-monoxide dehydrogenase medium subunit
MPAVLCLLDGVVELRSSNGMREVPATDFFEGPMQSCTRAGELAVAARFARPPPDSGSAFLELARRQGDYAMCGVGALVTTDGEEAIVSARVALISVGDGPVLVEVTRSVAGSGGFDESALRALVDEPIDPEPDIHATAEYRRHLAHVLTLRALDEAYQRARRASRPHRVV